MGAGKFADRTTYEYPAFIMIDLNMPRAVGFTVLQHLKDNPEWAIVPTMVFSSSSDLDDIKKSYMLGASSYHVKPTSIATLREHLDVLHKYWMTCEIPEVHACGRRRTTDSGGKIGDRFGQASGSAAQVSAHFPTSVRDGFAADAKCSDRRNTPEKALDAHCQVWAASPTTRSQHEPSRQLLRQCRDGIVLEHVENRDDTLYAESRFRRRRPFPQS